MNRKAQITIFIILGLIIILSAMTVVYFYQKRVTAPIKKIVTVPEDVQQVYDYVATCVDQIGKDGLLIMGAQGGYIDIPAIMAKNPNANIPGDPAGITKTPMWYYEGEDRTPSLDYMQRELAMYVKQLLPDCVNFESFKPRYEITPASEILPVVSFTDEEVIIQVKWELKIKLEDRTTTITEFITSHPVKFKQMYELASNAMEAENKEGWFENLTIDLMSMNEDIPLSGMEFRCGTKKWRIQEVKKEIQQMLYYNFPYIRITNTNYPPPLEPIKTYSKLKQQADDIRKKLEADKEPEWPENPPADTYEINRMMFNIGAKKTDLKAAFTYQPEWPLLVNAQPNQGGTLSTAQMKGAKQYLRFLCINQWHFAYDLIYPVKLTIKDDTAFRGKGYTFQIAFPVIIEDNEESRIFFGLRKFVSPNIGIDFCENFGTTMVDVRAMGFVEGSPMAEQLDGANITYRCFNQECNLGTTYSDGTGEIRLTAYLPEGCGNPLLIANKEGYLSGQAHAKELTEIMLTRLQRMKYTIQVHPYYEKVDSKDPTKATDQKWLDGQSYTKFTKTMHATVTITARNTSLEQYKTYPANATIEETEFAGSEDVDFIQSNAQYDIDVLLFKGDTPVGGYHAENLTITYEELAGNNNVIFHAVEYRPLPSTQEEMSIYQAGMFMFLYERGKYGEQPYWQKFKPTFTP